MKIIREITLDFARQGVQCTIPVTQNDVGILRLRIHLRNGSEPVHLSQGDMATLYIDIDAYDLVNVIYTADSVFANTIEYELTGNVTSTVGEHRATLHVAGESDFASSPEFAFVVKESKSDKDICTNAEPWAAIYAIKEAAAASASAAETANNTIQDKFSEYEKEINTSIKKALENAKKIYVRYSSHPKGENFTEIWDPSTQPYIGIAVQFLPPTKAEEFTWARMANFDDASLWNIERGSIKQGVANFDEQGWMEATKLGWYIQEIKHETIDGIEKSRVFLSYNHNGSDIPHSYPEEGATLSCVLNGVQYNQIGVVEAVNTNTKSILLTTKLPFEAKDYTAERETDDYALSFSLAEGSIWVTGAPGAGGPLMVGLLTGGFNTTNFGHASIAWGEWLRMIGKNSAGFGLNNVIGSESIVGGKNNTANGAGHLVVGDGNKTNDASQNCIVGGKNNQIIQENDLVPINFSLDENNYYHSDALDKGGKYVVKLFGNTEDTSYHLHILKKVTEIEDHGWYDDKSGSWHKELVSVEKLVAAKCISGINELLDDGTILSTVTEEEFELDAGLYFIENSSNCIYNCSFEMLYFGIKEGPIGSFVSGEENTMASSRSSTGGRMNKVEHTDVNMHGIGLLSGEKNQTIFGWYNQPNKEDLFQIGNGESDTERSNAFRVTRDGRAFVKNDIELAVKISEFSGWVSLNNSAILEKGIYLIELVGNHNEYLGQFFYAVSKYNENSLKSTVLYRENYINLSVEGSMLRLSAEDGYDYGLECDQHVIFRKILD